MAQPVFAADAIFPKEPGLKDWARAAGLRFGSDSDGVITEAPPAYAAAMLAQCDLFAPNLGWHRVATRAGGAEPGWEDPNVRFALGHGLALTGGHLLWHRALPAWFLAQSAAAARQSAQAHIAAMTRHYAGRVFAWNVVNEAIDTDHGDALGMRQSAMLDRLGPGYIADAFQAARPGDPAALLTYNETNLDMDIPRHAARRDALQRLLDRLQRAGAPIQAVGLQSHLRLDGSRFDPALYRRFLASIAARGLRILITELDVFDIGVAGDIAQRDQAVAALYSQFLTTALDEKAVASVVCWGLSDRYSWLNPATDPSYRRMDGLAARPLPLDDNFVPKPAFAAIAAALRAAPVRAQI